MSSFQQVKERSGGHCEAYVLVNERYTRCFRNPVEVHHMLTRARGGRILDDAGETAHLIALCPFHHSYAHRYGGLKSGLMIDGYVTTGTDGRPVYKGSDRRLAHLGAMDMSDVQKAISDHPAGKGLRGQTRRR
jgi:hypothetical protein